MNEGVVCLRIAIEGDDPVIHELWDNDYHRRRSVKANVKGRAGHLEARMLSSGVAGATAEGRNSKEAQSLQHNMYDAGGWSRYRGALLLKKRGALGTNRAAK